MSDETEIIKETPKEKQTMAKQNKGLNILDPENSKFNLTTVTGRKVLWTLEEALKEHNFKQLSEKVQKMLKGEGGKSSLDIITK